MAPDEFIGQAVVRRLISLFLASTLSRNISKATGQIVAQISSFFFMTMKTYECLQIDYDSVAMPKNALQICYELTTIFWHREFVAKILNSSKLLP